MPSPNGGVTATSVNNFKDNFLGSEKLNKRANKRFFDNHDHKNLSQEILSKLAENPSRAEELGTEYEAGLSNSHKNIEGIYYTPKNVVNELMHSGLKVVSNALFCDPCCGSGNFLVRALELGFKVENIYGFDVDEVAVEISRRRIKELTGYDSPNIQQLDFLQVAHEKNLRFDFIFTNPPWGKKNGSKNKLWGLGRGLDICATFYFASLKSLKKGGILGFLLPEAFFNIASFQVARESMLSHEISEFKHFGRVFKGLLTPAVGVVLKKNLASDNYQIKCSIGDKCHLRSSNSFKKNPKKIFNMLCTYQEEKVIARLFETPHKNLKGHVISGLGIVTGNNKKHVAKEPKAGWLEIYTGADIDKGQLKSATRYISGDFEAYQQVAPLETYLTKPKLIYRFISSNLSFYHDREGRFVLNSANILIVKDSFPVDMKILCELFNSEFMNWVFNKIFFTHKVLLKDIKSLPIHTQFLQDGFNENDYLEKLGLTKEKAEYRVKTSC